MHFRSLRLFLVFLGDRLVGVCVWWVRVWRMFEWGFGAFWLGVRDGRYWGVCCIEGSGFPLG